MKWIGYLGVVLASSGIVITVHQHYNQPGEFPVPLILSGIACFLIVLIEQIDHIGNAILQIRQRLGDDQS